MTAMTRDQIIEALKQLKANGMELSHVAEVLGVPSDGHAYAEALGDRLNDDTEIDDTIFLSPGDDGVWISAWLHVSHEAAHPDFSDWKDATHCHWLDKTKLSSAQLLDVFHLIDQIEDPERLDDVVHSAAERHADKSDISIDTLSADASNANNEGVAGQLAFLASLNWTAKQVMEAIGG